MVKAFKNNMSPGVPKGKGFSPKAPGMVAAKAPSQGTTQPMKPHTLMGCLGKTKMPK
jgi:hypothetical protein